MEILEYIIGSTLALYSLITFLIGQVTIIMWIDNCGKIYVNGFEYNSIEAAQEAMDLSKVNLGF